MNTKDDGLIGLVEVPRRQVQIILETAYLYLEMGNYKDAEDVFLGCTSLLPRSEVPQLGLGQLYVSQKRYDKAITSYQKALELKPDSAEAYAFLGEVYLLQGKANEALLMLEKAQQFDKNDPPSAAEMAKSLLEAHREGCFIQKPL